MEARPHAACWVVGRSGAYGVCLCHVASHQVSYRPFSRIAAGSCMHQTGPSLAYWLKHVRRIAGVAGVMV